MASKIAKLLSSINNAGEIKHFYHNKKKLHFMTCNKYCILFCQCYSSGREKKSHKLYHNVCHDPFCKANIFPKVYVCALSDRTFLFLQRSKMNSLHVCNKKGKVTFTLCGNNFITMKLSYKGLFVLLITPESVYEVTVG